MWGAPLKFRNITTGAALIINTFIRKRRENMIAKLFFPAILTIDKPSCSCLATNVMDVCISLPVYFPLSYWAFVVRRKRATFAGLLLLDIKKRFRAAPTKTNKTIEMMMKDDIKGLRHYLGTYNRRKRLRSVYNRLGASLVIISLFYLNKSFMLLYSLLYNKRLKCKSIYSSSLSYLCVYPLL